MLFFRFFIENDAATPASKNIVGINHGDINTTINEDTSTVLKLST